MNLLEVDQDKLASHAEEYRCLQLFHATEIKLLAANLVLSEDFYSTFNFQAGDNDKEEKQSGEEEKKSVGQL